MTVNRTCTVSFLKSSEVPALNGAGVALTFGSAAHVYRIALRKYVSLDYIAYVHSADIFKAELAKNLFRSNIAFGKMALPGLVYLSLSEQPHSRRSQRSSSAK